MLVDPPYDMYTDLEPKLARYLPAVLADDGVLVLETDARTEPELPLEERTSRKYGSDARDGVREMITAICPGSYDPVTNGHVDVIGRAAGIFDRVVVGVVGEPGHKQPMFTIDERVEFLHTALAHLPNVEIDVFRELVVDFARKWDAKAIVKGLRVMSDFEWEFQMNQLNRHLAPDVETMYVMAEPERELRLVERREGDRGLRRRRLRARARAGRPPVQGDVPGRTSGNAGESWGLTTRRLD